MDSRIRRLVLAFQQRSRLPRHPPPRHGMHSRQTNRSRRMASAYSTCTTASHRFTLIFLHRSSATCCLSHKFTCSSPNASLCGSHSFVSRGFGRDIRMPRRIGLWPLKHLPPEKSAHSLPRRRIRRQVQQQKTQYSILVRPLRIVRHPRIIPLRQHSLLLRLWSAQKKRVRRYRQRGVVWRFQKQFVNSCRVRESRRIRRYLAVLAMLEIKRVRGHTLQQRQTREPGPRNLQPQKIRRPVVHGLQNQRANRRSFFRHRQRRVGAQIRSPQREAVLIHVISLRQPIQRCFQLARFLESHRRVALVRPVPRKIKNENVVLPVLNRSRQRQQF